MTEYQGTRLRLATLLPNLIDLLAIELAPQIL